VKRVLFTEEARAEALDAFRWYEEQRAGLGRHFRAALGAAVTRIRRDPLAYPVVRREMRRTLVERFPYLVLYRIFADVIVVVGVVHGRRDPGRWQRR
jgi:plasmid stabilization system protein ParE